MISMDSTALNFNPVNYIFEAEEEQEQEQQPQEQLPQGEQQPQEQLPQGEQQPQEQQEQLPQGEQQPHDEHSIEKLIDLESMQKYLLFRKLVSFKNEFETKLKYIEITDNELIDPIRDILELLFDFFPQFNIPQITAILNTLSEYLEKFYKTRPR